MNLDVKYWSSKNLGGLFDKEILMGILSKYKFNFEFYKKPTINPTRIPPTRLGKIIYFDKKKNDSFYLHYGMSSTVMKILIASVFAVVFMSMLSTSFISAEKPIENYVNIQVRSGDTVWTIASRYASNKEDLREMVYAIQTVNGLDRNALIYSGQTLKIPTPTDLSTVALKTSPQ